MAGLSFGDGGVRGVVNWRHRDWAVEAAIKIAGCDLDDTSAGYFDRLASGQVLELREKLFCRRTRVRRQADFDYIKRSGRNRAGIMCAVQVAPPREPGWRVAIVISRHFSLQAVTRNRAKRLLREACRQVLPEFAESWLIIRPRYRIKRAKLPIVVADLRMTLRQIGVKPVAP